MRALTARVRDEDLALAERFLAPPDLTLFGSMSRGDQRHAIELARCLHRQGHRDVPLLRAALLHDVGKARHLRLWHRVAIVLTEWFTPAMVRWLASERPGSWGYPFHVYLNHPQFGAEVAKEAGCDRLTTELIRRHHESESDVGESQGDRLLAVLQAADDRM